MTKERSTFPYEVVDGGVVVAGFVMERDALEWVARENEREAKAIYAVERR